MRRCRYKAANICIYIPGRGPCLQKRLPGGGRGHSFEKGNAQTALADLNDAVVTESTAKKYFGDADPIGKTLVFGNESYVVKAVLQDPPANAHLTFHIHC